MKTNPVICTLCKQLWFPTWQGKRLHWRGYTNFKRLSNDAWLHLSSKHSKKLNKSNISVSSSNFFGGKVQKQSIKNTLYLYYETYVSVIKNQGFFKIAYNGNPVTAGCVALFNRRGKRLTTFKRFDINHNHICCIVSHLFSLPLLVVHKKQLIVVSIPITGFQYQNIHAYVYPPNFSLLENHLNFFNFLQCSCF